MAEYPVFQQVQPNIDVHLFGDAAQAGAKLGQEIPNPITSAITGAQEGYKLGVQEANTEANTADTIALTKERETQAQIDQLNLQTQQATQDATIKAEKAKAQLAADQATKADEDLTVQDQIEQRVASQDPDQIAGIYQDPKMRGLLLSDDKLADKVAGSIYGNKKFPDALQQQALGTLGIAQRIKFQEYEEKIHAAQDAKAARDYDKYSQELSGTNAETMLKGIPENQWKSRVQTLPQGAWAALDNGNLNTNEPIDWKKAALPENANHQTLFVDGKPVGSITNREANSVANKISSIDGRRRTIARLAGMPPEAADYSPPTDTGHEPAGPPSISTFGSQNPVPENAPLPNENPDIVTQSRDDFNKAVQSLPPGTGMTKERLLQRRDAARQQIKSQIGPTPSALLNQGVNKQAQANISTQANAPKPDTDLTPSGMKSYADKGDVMHGFHPADFHPGDRNLSYLFKQVVSLNTDDKPILKDEVKNRIQSDPLTAAESPFIQGMVAQESAGKRGAVSPTGVKGLFQVTKDTAEMYGLNRDIPEQNMLAGKLYITQLLHQFGGDLRLALAAYNAGPGVVSHAVRNVTNQGLNPDWPTVKDELQTLLNPKKFKETAVYPDRVLSYATQFMGNGHDADQSSAYLLENNGLIKKANLQLQNEQNI